MLSCRGTATSRPVTFCGIAMNVLPAAGIRRLGPSYSAIWPIRIFCKSGIIRNTLRFERMYLLTIIRPAPAAAWPRATMCRPKNSSRTATSKMFPAGHACGVQVFFSVCGDDLICPRSDPQYKLHNPQRSISRCINQKKLPG